MDDKLTFFSLFVFYLSHLFVPLHVEVFFLFYLCSFGFHIHISPNTPFFVFLFIVSTSHCQPSRKIRSFLPHYQRSQQVAWAAASEPTVWGTGAQEVVVAWWCREWEGTPYPSGRNRWTLGTVRGWRRGGGCCRPSAPPPSGRTQPRRAPTASRSTSPKPRLDFERTLLPYRVRSSAGCCRFSRERFPSLLPLMKQAMAAIVVSWNSDILTQRPRP